jgi:hypothetical protein
MAINALWHRHFGPGGGTRRLHQILESRRENAGFSGGETGSTSAVKAEFLLGMVSTVIGPNLEVPTITLNFALRLNA